MANPRAVEGLLDATVSRLDDLGGNCADEGIECLCADGIYDAFADFLRVKPTRLEAFGQGRIFIGANFWPAHMLRTVACATRDIGVDWTWAQRRCHALQGPLRSWMD